MRGAATPSDPDVLIVRPGLTGRAWCAERSARADGWLRTLLGDVPGVALVAVGGYGREELAPYSDLDVVLLHTGQRDVAVLADRVWYPIWDAGVKLDHSVRTVREALAIADSDVKAVLGLLHARHVAGDESLTAELIHGLRQQWRRRAPRALAELRTATAARHERFGELAFLLEPDLKESRGGLRDVHAVRAAAAAWVVDVPDRRVTAAYDRLLDARVALHQVAGRRTDVLSMQEQSAVAAALGEADAFALMASLCDSSRSVAYALDETWRRVDAWTAGRSRRLIRPARSTPLAPGLALHTGEVVLTADAAPSSDPALPLRAAVAAAHSARPLSSSLLKRLASETPPMPDPWPADARDVLVALLGSGPPAIALVEDLDQHGLLVRLLPEWAQVRNRPQRNPYHRFTVDRHLCEAAANAAALTRRVARPDLLLVGTWLHDIGKGFPGDHTDAGVEVVDRIARRMGFGTADVQALVSMVRHHLLLADIATRRDLDDPATVAAVVSAVADRDLLDLLAALSEADGLATGPSAWGEWKAGLIADLVRRAHGSLSGERAEPAPGLLQRHAVAVAAGELCVQVDADTVIVVAPDRPGLLARVAGVLALHRLDVRAAVVASTGGMAVQEITVTPTFGAPPDPVRVEADLRSALSDRLDIDARMAERARAYAQRAPVPHAPPSMLFDDEASAVATVVEVRAPDAVGLLYRITKALAECELDVRSAKVQTLGHEVVDTFYVVDATGARLASERHGDVERAVLAALAPA